MLRLITTIVLCMCSLHVVVFSAFGITKSYWILDFLCHWCIFLCTSICVLMVHFNTPEPKFCCFGAFKFENASACRNRMLKMHVATHLNVRMDLPINISVTYVHNIFFEWKLLTNPLYRRLSLFAVFLSAVSKISFFKEPILEF